VTNHVLCDIRRYYYWNLIIPTALIAVSGLMVFVLPAECSEKISLSICVTTLSNCTIAELSYSHYNVCSPLQCTKLFIGVTVLLSLTIFMMVVAENLPRTSQEIPLLSIYFGGTMFLLSMAIACSIWVLDFHFLSDAHEPPDWVYYKIVVSLYIYRSSKIFITVRSSNN
jgi:hypothetical protein